MQISNNYHQMSKTMKSPQAELLKPSQVRFLFVTLHKNAEKAVCRPVYIRQKKVKTIILAKRKKNEREKSKKEENNKKQNNKNTKPILKQDKPFNYYQRTCKKVPMSESTKRRK